MENNKTYLQRIHWAAAIALAFYLLIVLVFSDSLMPIPTKYFYELLAVGSLVCPFIAIGVVIRNWKAPAIAGVVALALYFINQNISYNTGRSEIHLFLSLLLHPLPMVLLVILHTGWTGKVGMIYLLCLLASGLGGGQLISLFEGLDLIRNRHVSSFIDFTCYIGVFAGHVIFVCEIINFSNGKTHYGKTRLLNLGNIYPKNNTVLALWCIKAALWGHAIAGMLRFESLMERFQKAGRKTGNFVSEIFTVEISFYHYLTAILAILSWIAAGLLLAWYLRKFMLEAFVSFGLRSKLIYWLSFLPFIGFLFFAFSIGGARQQQLYIEKKASIEQFANDNPISITFAFLLLVAIRLFMLLSRSDTIGLISLVITVILFLWMTKQKIGFYVYLYLNLVLLAVGLVAMFFAQWPPQPTSLLMESVLLGAMQLIYLFPAYHFEEFEYIPAGDPEPGTTEADGEFHLFPVIK